VLFFFFTEKERRPEYCLVKQTASQGCAARGEEMKHDFSASD